MTRAFDQPDTCFICRRRACGLAVGGHGRQFRRVGWLCVDCADGLYGPRALAMTDRQFDEAEQRALMRAGEEAGAYLDRVRRTDLATLLPEDWRIVLGLIVTGFGRAIREEVGAGTAVQGWIEPPLPAHRNIDGTDEEAA